MRVVQCGVHCCPMWGAGVRALASHQCDPGSIPRSGVKCGLSLLVLFSAPRGFLRILRFPSPQKPKFDLIVLIVNLIYSVPNWRSSARKTSHLNKVPYLTFFFLYPKDVLPAWACNLLALCNSVESQSNFNLR